MIQRLLLIVSIFYFSSFFSQAQTIKLANKEPGKLEAQIRDEFGKEEVWDKDSKEKNLVVKGILAKEDVHYIASIVKEKNINKLDLSNSEFREIGFGLFENCTSLTTIQLPNTVRTIAKQAFKNCQGLSAIDLPTSLTSIGTEAFAECSHLSQVSIKKKLSWIGTDAFKGCPITVFKVKKNNEYKYDGTHLYSKNGTIIY